MNKLDKLKLEIQAFITLFPYEREKDNQDIFSDYLNFKNNKVYPNPPLKTKIKRSKSKK